MDHLDLQLAISVRAIAAQLREDARKKQTASVSQLDKERWEYQHPVSSFAPAALAELRAISKLINETEQN